ncbi:hypothetical protein [Dactylosporangium sp. NPDC051541]|uniref:hypothetical protein n=1 Tax=Dactylosporangium sp. NPDC051541 TaxID=3363977 RepID=UPI0037A5DE4D
MTDEPANPTPDEALGAALRSLWHTGDPVPETLLAAGFGALGWRDVDGAFARLVEDTGAEHTLAHVRGGHSPARLLTFAAGDLMVVLELAGRRLLGQLDPAAPATVAVESAAGPHTVRADDHGRFRADDLPAGWLRLAVAFDGGERLRTAWFGT